MFLVVYFSVHLSKMKLCFFFFVECQYERTSTLFYLVLHLKPFLGGSLPFVTHILHNPYNVSPKFKNYVLFSKVNTPKVSEKVKTKIMNTKIILVSYKIQSVGYIRTFRM